MHDDMWMLLKNNNKVWHWLISIFLMIIVIIPTGNVYGVNVKIFSSVTIAFLMFVRITMSGNIPLSYIVSLLGYLLFLSLYAVWSIFNGFDISNVLSAFNIYFATFLVPWLLMLAVRIRCVSINALVNIFLLSIGFFSLLKVVLFILAIGNIINFSEFLTWMHVFFGYSPITHDYGWVIRINMPSDYILMPALVLSLNQKYFKLQGFFSEFAYARVVLILLILFSAFLTMSRFYILYFIITVIVSFGIRLKSDYSTKQILFIILSVFLVLVNVIIFWDLMIGFAIERFSGENAMQSDSVRSYLLPLFVDLISESPFVGYGLGSYILGHPYYDDMPWNYVLFWLSSMQQFGVIGLLVMLAYIAIPVKGIIKSFIYDKSILIASSLLLLYIMWLFTGVFSSYLLSSQAGVSFLGYYLISYYFSRKARRVLS